MKERVTHSILGSATSAGVDIFSLADTLPFHDLHFWVDNRTGLQAIVSIDNTVLGPAIGGCRFVSYPSTEAAIEDALRLSHSMSLKTAINHVPFGGGKAVILKPAEVKDRPALFRSLGEFIESLNGRYITGMDSGTTLEDMNNIAQKTRHVVCTSQRTGEHQSLSGDPSPYTAEGVYQGMLAAAKFKLNRDKLKGLTVAIQGAGHVGYQLAKRLAKAGCHIQIADTDEKTALKLARDFDARVVAPTEIYGTHSDIFSPCALGQTINTENLKALSASIIAGSANNQLADVQARAMIAKKGILYAPDFVINSGGLLQIAYSDQPELLNEKIMGLYATLLDIFMLARQQQRPTEVIATRKAEAILRAARKTQNHANNTPLYNRLSEATDNEVAESSVPPHRRPMPYASHPASPFSDVQPQ